MERKEYLELCRKTSVFPKKSGGLRDIPEKEIQHVSVTHKGERGVTYLPERYELSFTDGKPTHTAVLHSLTANSITYVDLNDVEKSGGKK